MTQRREAERSGSEGDRVDGLPSSRPIDADERPPVTMLQAPMRLDYTVTAGRNLSTYLRGIANKQIIGGRCPVCTKVYLPPRGACPTCGVPAVAPVQVADVGTITTFCVIRIPFDAAPFPPPYIAVAILLDGADMPIFHLLRGIEPDAARMGMRVRAVWVPDDQLGPTLASIRWFEPTGEPDVAYEAIASHL